MLRNFLCILAQKVRDVRKKNPEHTIILGDKAAILNHEGELHVGLAEETLNARTLI